MDTKEQFLALLTDRHLAVTANAGSGKTRTLVKRYVNLLLQGVKPSEIVAITFTRKAASEMLARVNAEVEKIRAETTEPIMMKELQLIRQRLTNARIMTIHSFCNSILRAYPIEADVNPFFADLTPADSFRIRTDAILGVFELWWNDNSNGKRIKFENVNNILGRVQITEILNSILDRYEIFPKIKQLYNNDFDNFRVNLLFHSNKFILNPLYQICLQLGNFVKNLGMTKSDSLSAIIEMTETVNKFILLYNALQLIIEKIIGSIKPSKNEIIESFEIIGNMIINFSKIFSDKIFTQKLEFRSEFKKASGLVSDELDELHYLIHRHKKLIANSNLIANQSLDKTLFELNQIITELVDDVQLLIEEQKEIFNGLDYNDMLLKTHKLLENPDFARQIAGKIKYILVDEFQDTNRLQFDIVKQLIADLNHSLSLQKSMNLYIVGDPKQSIYGFRYADVRVFKTACSEIIKANKANNLKSSKNVSLKEYPELEGEIVLGATFRLKPVIAAFVNKVCRNLMNDKESDYDVDYSELICGRIDVAGILSENLHDNILIADDAELFGSVSFIAPLETISGDEGKAEALLTSKYIKHLVLKGLYIAEKSQGKIEPEHENLSEQNSYIKNPKFKYSDICVLARTRTKIPRLAQALNSLGIPYVVHSGTGFYEAPEVMDMINFFGFLANPNDDFAFISLLCSPFIGIDDTDLLIIGESSNGNSLWEKFQAYVGEQSSTNVKSGQDLFLLNQAHSLLQKYRSLATQVSISGLILNFMEDSYWKSVINNSPASKQKIANLEKLVQYARDFESRGFRNLYDFVEELKLLQKHANQEAEATFISGEDAVNIMTIHAAKGLEFPVVILYDTNSSGNINERQIISDDLGISYKFKYESESNSFIDAISLTHYLNSRMDDLKGLAEEKRILYVAMTRAKDHLIISYNPDRNNDSLFRLICKGLNIPFDFFDIKTNDFQESETLSLLIQNNEESTEQSISIEFPCRIIRKLDDDLNYMEQSDITIQDTTAIDLTGNIGSEVQELIISPSKLDSYHSDKSAFFRKYRLGAPENNAIVWNDIETGEVKGSLFGIIMHRHLSGINNWLDDKMFIDTKIFLNNLQQILISQNEFDLLGSADEINKYFTSIQDSLKFEKIELGGLNSDVLFNSELAYKTKNQYEVDTYLLQQFVERIFNESLLLADSEFIRKNRLVLSTAEFEYWIKVPFKNDFVNGIIDVLITRNDGTLEIWDWKTNLIHDETGLENQIKHYELQMKLYCYLASLMNPNQVNFNAYLVFTYLVNRIEKKWYHKFEWTREELLNFYHIIENDIDSIRATLYPKNSNSIF